MNATPTRQDDFNWVFTTPGPIILLVDFFYNCYYAFMQWGYTNPITDRLFEIIGRLKFFDNPQGERLVILGLVFMGAFLSTAPQKKAIHYRWPLIITLLGMVLLFVSGLVVPPGHGVYLPIARSYMFVYGLGFLMVTGGGPRLARALKTSAYNRFFNEDTGGFRQEERRIVTDRSLNFRARYVYNGRLRKSWINIINPRRGVLLIGSPGSGKSRFIIEPAIEQMIQKGVALFIYDFKYPALTNLAYNAFRNNRNKYPGTARFYRINFSDLSRSHRCNVIDPTTINHFSDAAGISKTILFSMNTSWAQRSGEFFQESAINLVATIIWYLKKYKGGIYCTLPHVIQLAQTRQDELLTILNAEPSTSSLVSNFVQSYINKTTEMLDGQFASALVPLTRLTSPDIFYVLSGDDLSLDINDPAEPAILCLGGEPARQQALAPVMSLFIDRLNNRVNQAGRHPSALILDEFGTVRAASVLTTFATARSNDVSTIISVQDLSQLQTQYSNAEARQIMNSTGNLICGMISGETAGLVSDRFASSIQYKTTIAVNSMDTSVSKSEQTTPAVTPATLGNLSSGEFVGIVADDPNKRIEKKGFHAEILIEEEWETRLGMHIIPEVRVVTDKELEVNFNKIKTDIQILVRDEIKRILNDPALRDKQVKR